MRPFICSFNTISDEHIESPIQSSAYRATTKAWRKRDFCPNIQIARRSEENGNDILKKKHWHDTTAASTTYHYVCLFILGLVSWGLLWSALGDPWRWGGEYFTIVAVVVTAWATGELLQAVTGLPPLLASLLTGILARHLDILDMRNYVEIDVFLRYMFPVVVLGKGALAWDLSFMRRQWARVVSLGALPWASEVVTVAICTRFLFDFPWLWGFLFGFVYSSVSGPVVMPAVQRAVTLAGGGGAGAGTKLDLARLVCTASGTDTALSVGFCGLVHAFMFYDAHITYRYVKLGVTPFVGVALGASWGCLAGLVPHWRDTYISEIRILLVLLTGLFANYLAGNFGWGGTVGVGVLVCNAVAAHYWSKSGWPLNKNPAATAYRVIWALCEPMLFTYTGTFFVLKTLTGSMVLRGLALLVVCLTVRLAVVSLVCVGMPLKHRLFVCCAFTPKAIVETVLGPLAINTLLVNGGSPLEKEYAEDWLRLLVQAIFITTPLGYLLTLYLGPLLLRSNTVATCDIGENHKADG